MFVRQVNARYSLYRLYPDSCSRSHNIKVKDKFMQSMTMHVSIDWTENGRLSCSHATLLGRQAHNYVGRLV